MGVYLSAPIVEKESFDEECNGFTYGASSMQGWRMSQEDAHNCIPQFDKESGTSFFAVYDGHGGAEVAQYVAQKFPDFVKSLIKKSNKDDILDNLMESAFLSFDATLIEDEVVKRLKEIAGKDDDNDEEEMTDIPVGSTEADMLKVEADMPLEQLLAKYKTNPNSSNEEIARNGESGSGCSSSELPSSSSASSSGPSSSLSKEVNGPNTPSQSSNVNNNNEVEKSEEKCNSSAVKEETTDEAGCGSSEVSSTSGGGSLSGSRTNKPNVGLGIASLVCGDDDDDSSDDSEDEESWEDCDDDDDDEDDEDVDNDEGPTMDMTNEEPGCDSGCTACVVLKQGNKLIVANAGDSRCVLSRAGVVEELSFDHKPEDDPERERIEKAGGKVTADGRVNGGLNLSRAFGDHVYKRNKELPLKEQMISPLPDIKTIELTNNDEFFVIACDGIWNSLSSQEVVDFVRERMADPEKRKKPSLINEELFEECLAPNILGDGTGCDNMTCIIVVLDGATISAKTAKPKETVESLGKVDEDGDKDEQKDIKSKETVESSDQNNAGGDKDGQNSSLKRVVENDSEQDQAKKLKVSEEEV